MSYIRKLFLFFLILILILLYFICNPNKYEKNKWFSNNKLSSLEIEDLPEISNTDYLIKNDKLIYLKLNYNDFNSYANDILLYLKTQNFEYLGTTGEIYGSLAGILTTYYFKEADILEDFYLNGKYIFIYSGKNKNENGVNPFMKLELKQVDDAFIKYKGKEFHYNTIIELTYDYSIKIKD